MNEQPSAELYPRTSPTPIRVEHQKPNQKMDFPDAMRAVMEGNRVTKLEWNNPEIVVWLDTRLAIKLADGEIRDLIVSDGDMYGDDWVIV